MRYQNAQAFAIAIKTDSIVITEVGFPSLRAMWELFDLMDFKTYLRLHPLFSEGKMAAEWMKIWYAFLTAPNHFHCRGTLTCDMPYHCC